MSPKGNRTLTDTLPITQQVVSGVSRAVGVTPHARVALLLATTTIPTIPPYITRTRKLLSYNIPFFLMANLGVVEGKYEPGIPEAVRFEVLTNGQLLDLSEPKMVPGHNTELKRSLFFWSGVGSGSFQNAVDISHTTQLELRCWVELSGLTTEAVTYEVQLTATYNATFTGMQAAGANPIVQGSQGSFLYEETDRYPDNHPIKV